MRAAAAGALIFVAFAGPAISAEKTYNLTCDKLKVQITVDVDPKFDMLWRGKTATMTIEGQAPEKLSKDETEPSGISYKNKRYEFYSVQRITTLTDNSKKNAFYDCDWQKR